MTTYKQLIKELLVKFGKDIIQSTEHHHRIEVQTKNDRTQVVELIYKPKQEGEMDTSRFVAISPIGPIFRSFNYEEILKHNAKISVGAICIDEFKNNEGVNLPYLAVRATHLVHTAQLEEIYELITEVAGLADELEKDIYGKDLF